MSSHVLVTGGAGFIGSHTVDALLARGHRVRVLDFLHPQVHGPSRVVPAYLTREAELVVGDVRDPDTVRAALRGVDLVVHDAALVGVGQSQYEPAEYFSHNVMGTAVLLDVLGKVRHDVRALVVASSMSIYGEGRYACPEHGPVDPELRSDAQLERRDWAARCPACGAALSPAATPEDRALRSASFYAKTKKDQEEMCLLFGRIHGLRTVALRYFNVYGPRQSLNNPYTGVAAIFLSRLLNGSSPLVYEDGHQSRDFTSVHDIVRAKLLAIEGEVPTGAYNVGTGRRTSVLELARTLADLTGAEVAPTIAHKYRSGDIRDCYADVGRLAAFGYEAATSLEDGLRELAAWSAEQRAEDRIALAHGELVSRGLVW